MVPKKGGLGAPAWSVVFRAAVVVAEIFSSRSGARACACRGGGRFAFAASEGGSFGARLAIDGEQLGISVRHGGSAVCPGLDALTLPAPRDRAGNNPIAIPSTATEVLASCFSPGARRSFAAALLPVFSAWRKEESSETTR
jgi:hypothetical protein